jgi:oxygen-independent coproporphyrinogen-3 oxidase
MRHVYVHVPFCRRRCSYCDFAIAVRRSIPAERYVAAIRREHELRRASEEWDDEPLETLYFGGGTPSLLPPQSLTELIWEFHRPPSSGAGRGGAAWSSTVREGEGVEVTVEANPDDVAPHAAAEWRAAGVNRVSLGVQSFDHRVLEWMHRTHDAAQPALAVRTLREAGFDNLSLDLIFALPDPLRGNLQGDLDRALALEPEHLSVYGLSIEPRTPLARWVSRGTVASSSEEGYAEEFLLAHGALTGAGYEHYEVSNYARPGRRARHNSSYWSGEAYAGLGPSAHGFARGVRRWNVPQWTAYQRALAEGRTPEEAHEVLTDQQQRLERAYLALRTSDGVPAAAIPESVQPVVRDAMARGLLTTGGGRIRATPNGWLVLDQLVPVLTT